jgi:hypothetical protein
MSIQYSISMQVTCPDCPRVNVGGPGADGRQGPYGSDHEATRVGGAIISEAFQHRWACLGVLGRLTSAAAPAALLGLHQARPACQHHPDDMEAPTSYTMIETASRPDLCAAPSA